MDRKNEIEFASDLRTKVCGSCKTEKSLDEFYVQRRRGREERQARCKSCANGRRWENGRFKDETEKQKALKSNRESYARNRSSYLDKNFARQLRYKLAAMDVLGGPQCARCPERHPYVLEFHHQDPSDKLFEITKALGSPGKYGWDAIVEEISKCELLCVRCHAIEHLRCDVVEVDGSWIVKAKS